MQNANKTFSNMSKFSYLSLFSYETNYNMQEKLAIFFPVYTALRDFEQPTGANVVMKAGSHSQDNAQNLEFQLEMGPIILLVFC